MANHVRTNVYFERINDAAKAKLQELYSRIRPDTDYEWFADLMVDGAEGSPTHEEAELRGWNIDNVGAKWCYFEDRDDEQFTTESAWSWPQEGVEWLIVQLAEVDPELITVVRYEDEMPNFYGAYVYKGNELIDGCEDTWEELVEMLNDGVEGLAEHWDEEEEYWNEEGRDLMYDHLYDYVNDRQDTIIADALDSIGPIEPIVVTLDDK